MDAKTLKIELLKLGMDLAVFKYSGKPTTELDIVQRMVKIRNNVPNDMFHKLMTGELKLSDL